MNANFLQVSLDNPELLAKLLPRCSMVIHLASARPGNSVNHPALELGNLAPSLRLLEALQAYLEIHLIFFSSGGTIYGNAQHLPVHEDEPTAPLFYHGAGKVALEAFFHAFRSCGQAATILRPSAYGPAQALKGGFGLVRTMLEHACCGTPLKIWDGGKNVRDFIYFDNITEACARFKALPHANGNYNLSTGSGYSINLVRRIVEPATGTELKTICHPARGIDVRAVVLDISRLNGRFSWKPKISHEEGVRRIWKWLKQA